MLLAVFLFTVMDALAKRLTLEIGLISTLWNRYVGQAGLVLLIISQRLMSVVKSPYPKLQLLRSIVLLTVAICF